MFLGSIKSITMKTIRYGNQSKFADIVLAIRSTFLLVHIKNGLPIDNYSKITNLKCAFSDLQFIKRF